MIEPNITRIYDDARRDTATALVDADLLNLLRQCGVLDSIVSDVSRHSFDLNGDVPGRIRRDASELACKLRSAADRLESFVPASAITFLMAAE